ncbi:hypothetical protein V2W45_1340058 [Cenococcum geophilum]
MDPITALGAAAAIAQFVGFAVNLVSASKETFDSAKGSVGHIQTIEDVYGRLRDLSTLLRKPSKMEPGLELLVEDKSLLDAQTSAINDLSQVCINECNKLLEVAPKLKCEPDSRTRWQSFRIALMTVWKEREIASLEKRLQGVQVALTLQVCSLTSVWQRICYSELTKLRSESQRLSSRHSARLNSIYTALGEINTRLETASSENLVHKPFSPAEIESLESQMSRLSFSESNVAKEQKILKSLSFESRPTRFQSVPEAHRRTYCWIFENQKQSPSDVSSAKGNVLSWLKTGQDWFWVSGKPGSGKSTLMKYIASHPKTSQALSEWAQLKTVVIASHYFWSAGTPMQRSFEGLLRTLLYDIFRQLPDLIETTCIERWPKPKEQLGHEDWYVSELHAVLKRIGVQETISAKFCFFIDGLDEFDGDHVDFCATLCELTKSPHVKLCVSSRPWNVFEYSFGRSVSSKLYMHELTLEDIRSYSKSRLKEHPRWPELHIESQNAKWLVDQITQRAAGVFLWVFLVTQLLRNGLTEYDNFSDMKKRLDSVPRDLEAFFKQILESVEPFYNQKMATTLKIALTAKQPALTAIYDFHEKEWEDEDYALKLPIQTLDASETEARQKQMTRRLNARCRGLLEVNGPSDRVEFLHRTVMDYLRTQEMTEYLDRKVPVDFDPSLSLLRAFLAYLKSTQFLGYLYRRAQGDFYGSKVNYAVQETLGYAMQLGNSIKRDDLLTELEHCLLEMMRTGQILLELHAKARLDSKLLDLKDRVRFNINHAPIPGQGNNTVVNEIQGVAKLYFLESLEQVLPLSTLDEADTSFVSSVLGQKRSRLG